MPLHSYKEVLHHTIQQVLAHTPKQILLFLGIQELSSAGKLELSTRGRECDTTLCACTRQIIQIYFRPHLTPPQKVPTTASHETKNQHGKIVVRENETSLTTT